MGKRLSLLFASVTLAIPLINLVGHNISAQPFPASVAKQLPIDRTTDLGHVLRPAVKATARVSNGSPWGIRAEGPLALNSALSSFMVAYQNGNHAQRLLGVHPVGEGQAHIYLADGRSADDPVDAAASWWTIPGATGGVVSGDFTANNDIAFTLPNGPAWHYLVLSGFQIRATNSVNNFDTGELNVSRLSVSTQPAISEARVNAPPRIFVNFETHRPGTPIQVFVHYVWVPNNYLKKLGTSEYIVDRKSASNRTIATTGPSPFGGGVLGTPGTAERAIANIRSGAPNTDRILLTAFDLQFTNEPRPLLAFGVHLNGDIGRASPSPDAISWQDNNRDDPINWSASYVMLK